MTLETRPIYHSSDAAICGHVFCSFLAFVLIKELQTRCEKIGPEPEWGRLVRDLNQLQIAEISLKVQQLKVRTSP